MQYVANKVHDHLYQGGAPPPGDGLKKAGIDVLVLCAREWQDATLYPGLTVIQAPGDDDGRIARLLATLPLWQAAADQVVAHVRSGHNVLVTCIQGLNRSGFVVALALHQLTRAPGKQLVGHIQRCRRGALFNTTFAQYLADNLP